tara:strand:- start:8530 stop:8997 length:468 start_codon:yes stop_codon:yes gene_type:complete
MSTRKIKSRNKTNITPRNRPRSSGVATLSALMKPSYHLSQNPVLAEKREEELRDLEERKKKNSLINELMKDPDYRGIVDTWKNTKGDVKPLHGSSQKKTLKRSLPIAIGLNNLNKSNGGRKRNSTKKKRHSKTKKGAIKKINVSDNINMVSNKNI